MSREGHQTFHIKCIIFCPASRSTLLRVRLRRSFQDGSRRIRDGVIRLSVLRQDHRYLPSHIIASARPHRRVTLSPLSSRTPFRAVVVGATGFDDVTELVPGFVLAKVVLDSVSVVTVATIGAVSVIDCDRRPVDDNDAATVVKLAALVPVEAVAYGATLKFWS